MKENLDKNEIRILPYPDCFRDKIGMYLGGNQDFSQSLLEILSNSFDEAYANPKCNSIIIDQNWGGSGLNLVADMGRGIPIMLSKDVEGKTQAYVSLTSFHSGTKFYSTGNIKTGSHGIGSKAVCATSQNYILLSKITEDNYDKSIPAVLEAWNNYGPRQRKDLYYILIFEKGYLQYEGAGRIKDLEGMIFEKYPSTQPLPNGYSTIILFNADSDIYEKTTSKLPLKNIEYFCLILEKIYNRKINIIVNGNNFKDNFHPYQFEFVKEIVPKDNSKNPKIIVYCSFEISDDLEVRDSSGSINGLECGGIHVNWIEQAFELALKSEYSILKPNKFCLQGLSLNCLVLADCVNYDSQTKVRCKSIDKVKASDFQDIAKEFIKIFRKNSDIFEQHVSKLDEYYISRKSFSAKEKSMRMISSGRGVGFFKSRADLPKGFSDASSSNRLACELFLCIPGDEEVLLVNDKGEDYTLNFETLATIFSEGKDIDGYYTYATSSTGKSRKTKIIRCQKTRDTQEIVRITLTDGTVFRCTPNHKIFLVGGEKKEAQDLLPEDIIMFKEDLEKKNVRVASIQWENLEKEIPVYCLEVQSRDHNFTLKSGVVVSNSEGNSAAGSLIKGRHDTKYHAVMALRGKILNISDKDETAALENKEINAIFKLIGLGTSAGNVFDTCKTPEEVQLALEKYANYGKIILSTDADSDGSAIRNALVYTFAKMGRFVIDLGMLYLVIPPLFKQGNNYFYPDDPLQPGTVFPIGLNPTKPFKRWKGLGSMSDQEIYSAFYDPSTRRLLRVTSENLDYAMKLVEDINERKKLLFDSGIISNPYDWKDL